MSQLRGVCVGAGYFSQFHFDAWKRIDGVEIAAVCDVDEEKAARTTEEFDIGRHGNDFVRMLDEVSPDFVDIITPPASHRELVEIASQRNIPILCQKPLAPTFEEAKSIVQTAKQHDVRLMVHENFRFQPWHREIKRLLDTGTIGERLHSLTFRSRPGDGWGPDAYLGRQPYFREMPQLLIFETGVHFIDTFRFLAGEINGVYALLRRLNPVIRGEDCGLVVFEFASGAVGLWDANRYNQCNDPDPRFTFGEFLVEGSGGSIRLYLDGRMTIQTLGEPERDHDYYRERRGFGGDCVYFTLNHFAQSLLTGQPFETSGEEYVRTLAVQEAAYESARRGEPVRQIDCG